MSICCAKKQKFDYTIVLAYIKYLQVVGICLITIFSCQQELVGYGTLFVGNPHVTS